MRRGADRLQSCFAAALFAAGLFITLALAVPARAQSDSVAAEDYKACAAQGAGPDTAGHDDCMVQRKQARIRATRQRAAHLAAMPDPLNPMPAGHQYLRPGGIHAMESAPPAQPDQTKTTTTKVCVSQGDPANPETICRTDVETSKIAVKAPPARDYRSDPLSPEARTDNRPGDVFHDQTQY